MEDKLANLPSFDCENVPTMELRQKWNEYKKSFKYVASAMPKKKNKKQLRDIFLAVAGRSLQRVYESIPDANTDLWEYEEGQEPNPLETMFRELDGYFAPKQHDTLKRYTYWSLKPNLGEGLDKFLLRAQMEANQCDFGESDRASKEIALIDKMISLAPIELRRKLLEKQDLDLDMLTKMVNSHLSLNTQNEAFNASTTLSGTALGSNNLGPTSVNKVRDVARFPSQGNKAECSRCGMKGHDGNEMRCPARGKRCDNCNMLNHFAKKCQTSVEKRHSRPSVPRYQQPLTKKPRRFKSNTVAQVEDIGREPDIEEEEAFVYAVGDTHEEDIFCLVGGVIIEMMVDSGSRYNLMGDRSWEYLKRNGVEVIEEGQSNKDFFPYGSGSALKVVCKFKATLNIVGCPESKQSEEEFFVIEEGRKALLGRETAMRVGVLEIRMPSGLKAPVEVQQVADKTATPFPKIKGKRKFSCSIL